MPSEQDWDAEYQFWNKVISEEVERLRWNQGLEPCSVYLYPNLEKLGKRDRSQPDYIGLTRIGRREFQAIARITFDSEGRTVLKVDIYPSQQSEAQKAAQWANSASRLYNDEKQ
jgi:hypothetical protein